MRAVTFVFVTMCTAFVSTYAQQGQPPKTVPPSQSQPPPSLPATMTFQLPKDDGRPYLVHVPSGISPDNCSVTPVQVYQQGAAMSPGVDTPKVDRGAIAIPTAKNARALKAVIWCRGYTVATIDVPALAQSKYETAISPQRLRTVRVSGRIKPAGELTLASLEMQVRFDALWICGFFGLADCFVPTFPVATTRINPDGTFAFEVPDVLSDPIAKSYPFLGGFSMSVEEPPPSFRHYRLEPATGPTLAPASAYPDLVVLTIKG